MPTDHPVERMREYLEVIRLALAGGALDYPGRFFRFRDVRLSIVPSGPVPIWLGARRPRMLELAGEAADGVFLWLVGERETRDAIDRVRRAAARAGRPVGAVSTGCLVPACVDPDGGAARAAMRRCLVDFYLGRRVYTDVLARSGFAAAGEEVQALVAGGESEAAAARIPDEALDQLAISGTPAECRARIERWYARGLDRLTLYLFPADGDWPAAYRRAVADLAPR
jgi:alkanesulfonate monooxygenase SsuD/methylene tetrahydromethanopterin reductase-like flavin-dependent oxidoreductase (luciferase family)